MRFVSVFSQDVKGKGHRGSINLPRLSFVLLMLLCGCGGSAGEDAFVLYAGAPAVEGVARLPLPGELQSAPSRGGSYVEADLAKEGKDFELGLPSANVTVDGTTLDFSPDFAVGSSLDEAAYCFYRFTVPGYDREPQLRFERDTEPASRTDSWIGIANWETNRWVWFSDTADGRIELGSMTPYLNGAGELLVVPLLTGTAACDLASLRLGSPAPIAVLSADPLSGAAPMLVEFDASASSAVDGSITKFEWDVDGDGTFETDTATTATHSYEYLENGEFTPAVRVTNSAGLTAMASVTISLSPYWEHRYSISDVDQFSAAFIDPDDNVYLLGTVQFDAEYSLLLVKVAPRGATLWARMFEGEGNTLAAELGAHPDGGVTVVGHADNGGNDDCLAQHWQADGTLAWSKTVGSMSDESVTSGAFGAGNFYLCGDSRGGGPDSDVFVFQFDYDGSVNWGRRRDLGGEEYASVLSIKKVVNLESGITLGSSQYAGAVNDPWVVEWLANGNFVNAVQFYGNTSDIDLSGLVFYKPTLASTGTYYIAASMDVAGLRNMLLLAMPATGASIFGTRFALPDGQGTGLALGPQGDLFCTAVSAGATDTYTVLTRHSGMDGTLLSAESSTPVAGKLLALGIAVADAGIVVPGASLDAAFTWTEMSPVSTPVSVEWVDADGTGSEINLSSSDYLGNVTDVLEDLTLDSDGADPGAYAVYRGFPE